MGSIEDPSLQEPAAEPEAAAEPGPRTTAGADPASEQPAEPTPTGTEQGLPADGLRRTGHPVRDRLLAKAREAELQPNAAKEHGTEAPGSVESELLKVASSAGPGLPLRLNGVPLSSLSVLLLGTVFGLAGFALFFALLIEFAPIGPHEGSATTLEEPAGEVTTVSAVVSVTPPPPPPPRKRIPGPFRIGEADAGQRIIRGSIGKSPFLRAIQEAGLDKTQAYRVYTALKGEKDLDRCRPSDEFVALLDRSDGRVLAFEYIVNREEIYQARQGDDGRLTGKQLDLSVARGRVQGSLVIAVPSFAANATANHFDPGLGVIINKALEGHLTVEDFHVGDRLRVVAQEVTVLGEFSRYSGLEALEYLPAQGDAIRVYYFENKKRYYDSKGRAPGEGGWRRPVPGAAITSRFNPKRMHPILKKVMPHNGTDFGAPTGTPIFASSGGKIVKLGNYGANGNYIAIEHRGGYATGYSHLSRFEPGLKAGDTVQRLQPIGYVGSTGRSTGPHLHFSAKKDGQYIDPESLGLDRLTTLPKDELALFQKVKHTYDALLEEIPLPASAVSPVVAAVATTGADADHEADFHEGDSNGEGLEVAHSPEVERGPGSAAGAPRGADSNRPAALPPPLPVTPVAPARRAASALYLTDEELIQSQSRSDDGEVEQ
jgi:murein DD-endopeptidase MepM/ murein hydrolase activator NlpD